MRNAFIAVVILVSIAAAPRRGAFDKPVRVAGGLVSGVVAAIRPSPCSKDCRSPPRRSARSDGASRNLWSRGRASGRRTPSAAVACSRSSTSGSRGLTSS